MTRSTGTRVLTTPLLCTRVNEVFTLTMEGEAEEVLDMSLKH
jgi:hypothetical protein